MHARISLQPVILHYKKYTRYTRVGACSKPFKSLDLSLQRVHSLSKAGGLPGLYRAATLRSVSLQRADGGRLDPLPVDGKDLGQLSQYSQSCQAQAWVGSQLGVTH